jgi:hypothetical protein
MAEPIIAEVKEHIIEMEGPRYHLVDVTTGNPPDELMFEPDPSDQGEPFHVTSLACYAGMRVLTFEQRRSLAYIEALRLIINEEVDPQILQNALNALDHYKSEGEGNILGHINNGNLVLGHK